MNVHHHRLGAQPPRTLAKRVWALAGLIGILAAPLAAAKIAESNPFAIVDKALQLREDKTASELGELIQKQIQAANSEGANGFLLAAELLQQAGDYEAEFYFERAIFLADEEAAYELFYADYLRNVRGPQRPLFEEAEEHYFAALEKLERQVSPPPWSAEVRQRVLRGLVALYQEDGIPLAWREGTGARAPYLFFSSTARTARSMADLDEIHDVRDWTAEALFSQSAERLNRALSREELSGLVRRKELTVFNERLRYRIEGAAIDISYERRAIQNAQVTNFLRPNEFNRVQVDNLGAEVALAFNEAPSFDGYFRQAISVANRQGLIETHPSAREWVYQSETELGFSRFSGSNKTDFTLTYVAQDIRPRIANPPHRGRSITAARLSYQILRPLRWLRNPSGNLFATRGVHLFGGFADDWERFGAVGVRRDDFFVGTSLNGLGPFDVTLQPAIFREEVTGDKSRTSSQLRLDGTVVLRLLDEEAHPGLPGKFLGLHPAFIHLVISAKRDLALEGLSAFENDSIGIGVNTKLFVMPFDPARTNTARFGATTLLLSCHYSRERFPRLAKKVNLMELNFSLGF